MATEIHSHKDLIVWQKAMELVVLVYRYTECFPESERFGLISQMRRSAVSIPSNIAEGRRRGTRNDYRQFLLHAYGSGGELETQVEIARRLHFGKEEDRQVAEKLLDEVMRMLNAMITNLCPSPKKLRS